MASNLRVDSIVPSSSGNVSIGTATGGVTIPGDLGIAGVLTYEDVTNVDSIGVITARSSINVNAASSGIGVTINSGGINVAGVITATSFSGIDSDKISEGNTEVETIDTGSDGHVKFSTEGGERLRIGPAGQIGIAGANYGTAGQVLTSQGSGSAIQWAAPTIPHAFVFMDSQYFTSSVTLLEFNNNTTYDRSSGVTITRGGSERFTPTVAGVYFVQAHLTYSHGGGTYTPVLYIYRNGSGYSSLSSNNIVSYGGGHNDSLSCSAMMTFNGTSDYVDMRASHNGGGNATMKAYSTFSMFRVGA